MRRLWLVAIVACTPSARPWTPPARAHPVVRMPAVAVPPASPGFAPPLTIDLQHADVDVDPLDEQWPIVRPPSLEPHDPLAPMYGVRGPWAPLCAARRDPRGVDPDEALLYLNAWCELRNGSLDTGRTRLAALLDSRSLRIASAARADLVDLLAAQSEPAAAVLDWLDVHKLVSPPLLDALAGTYVATNRRDDALAIVRSKHFQWPDAARVTCHRLFREYMLVDGPRLAAISRELDQRSADPTCLRLAQQVSCPLALAIWSRPTCHRASCELPRIDYDLAKCTSILIRQPALRPRAYYLAALAHWPSQETSATGWLTYATLAARGRGSDQLADELVIAALETAARVSDCAEQLPQITAATTNLLPSPSPAILDRVYRLLGLTPSGCRSFAHSR